MSTPNESQQAQNRQREIDERLARNRAVEERRRQDQAQQEAARRKAENEAKREAAFEAHRRAKAEGAIGEGGRVTVRQTVERTDGGSTISSRVTRASGGRSTQRDQQQHAQSGAPVNLQGDKQAIQEIRAQAFQRAREKGGMVDQAAVNRETRAILAERGGSVSVVDRTAQKQAINEAYADFKRDKSIRGESDFPTMTPVRGPAGRFVYEGFTESGAKTTAVIAPPKTEKVRVDLPPPPDDPIAGFVNTFKNVGISYYLGFEGAFNPVGQRQRDIRPATRLNLERELEAEVIGSGIESGIGAVQGRPTTEGFRHLGSDIIASPRYFAGSGAASALTYLTPYGISRLLVKFAPVVAKLPPRARFDYSPQYGSFADRESVRFTRFQPTRWENPEMLADLAKFKMSIDAPKALQVAPVPVASARTAEAFVRVQSRQDPIIQTKGGALLLKTEPVRPSSKVESIALQTIKQQTRSDAGPSIRQTWKAPTIPLGIGGITGVERRRKREDSIFNTSIETVAFPQASSKVFERMPRLGSMSDQSNLTGLSSSIGQRGRQDIVQRSNIAQILRDAQLTSTMQSTMTAQITKQLTQQRTGQVFRTTTRLDIPTVPSKTIPTLPVFPWAIDIPLQKRKVKRGKTKAKPREGQIKSLLSVALGDTNKLAKAFNKQFGKRY